MKDLHPVVPIIYYAAVIGLSMFSDSPVFLIASFIIGLVYGAYLRINEGEKEVGFKIIKNAIIMFFFFIFFGALINGLFTHNGATVLFFLGPNRITLEAFIYGAVMSLILSSVIIWFISFGIIMTSDKLICVFGHFAPVIGLTISMIFRFIPLLRRRYKDIKMGQISLGRGNVKGPINKIKQITKELSILISWSLEAAIESADSMAARGYGLPGRSSYRLYAFRKRDGLIIAVIVLLTVATGTCFHLGACKIYYYPEIRFAGLSTPLIDLIAVISFIVLAFIPLIIDFCEELRWKKSL